MLAKTLVVQADIPRMRRRRRNIVDGRSSSQLSKDRPGIHQNTCDGPHQLFRSTESLPVVSSDLSPNFQHVLSRPRVIVFHFHTDLRFQRTSRPLLHEGADAFSGIDQDLRVFE